MYCFSFGNGTVIEMIVDKVTNDREPHTTITFHWIDDSQRNKFTFFHYDQDGRTQHPFRFIDDRSENDVVSCLSIASTLFLSPCSRLFPYPLVIMTLHLNRCHWMLTLIYHLPFSSIGTLRESRPVNRNKKIILMEDIWDNSMTFHKHLPKPTRWVKWKWINFQIWFHVRVHSFSFLWLYGIILWAQKTFPLKVDEL